MISRANVYIGDGVNDRILKVNGLTGNVINVLLLEENEKVIQSLLWSDTEPNLTMIRTKSRPTVHRTQNWIDELAVQQRLFEKAAEQRLFDKLKARKSLRDESVQKL